MPALRHAGPRVAARRRRTDGVLVPAVPTGPPLKTKGQTKGQTLWV